MKNNSYKNLIQKYFNCNKKIKNNNGVTLIALVITIIIIVILSSVTILSLTNDNNNVINSAKENQFKHKIATYQETILANLAFQKSKNILEETTSKNYYSTWESGNTDGTIKELIPDIPDEDAKKFAVLNGELTSINISNDEERTWLSNLNISTSSSAYLKKPLELKYNENQLEQKIVLIPGRYNIKLYGASGGKGMANGVLWGIGGYCAITSGDIQISETTTLYAHIGSQGGDAIQTDSIHSGGSGRI